MGPGDVLTLGYVFNHVFPTQVEDLLAARSLIHVTLMEKDELVPGKSETPRTEEDIRINKLVRHLSFEQCREVYERIRFSAKDSALRLVIDYIG